MDLADPNRSRQQEPSRSFKGLSDVSDLNRISGEVVDAAIAVHTHLGPGLLESTYETCLRHELRKRRLAETAQVPLPIIYDTIKLDAGYRVDLLVNECVVVELKSIDEIATHSSSPITHLFEVQRKAPGPSFEF